MFYRRTVIDVIEGLKGELTRHVFALLYVYETIQPAPLSVQHPCIRFAPRSRDNLNNTPLCPPPTTHVRDTYQTHLTPSAQRPTPMYLLCVCENHPTATPPHLSLLPFTERVRQRHPTPNAQLPCIRFALRV